jgi:hypothetical protein
LLRGCESAHFLARLFENMVVVRSSNLASNASLYADVTRQEIINQSLQVQSLIQVWHKKLIVNCARINNVQFQELNTCTGPQENLDALSTEVRSRIATLRKNIHDLENLAEEQDLEKDRLQLIEEAKSHRQMLSRLIKCTA